MMIMIMMMMRMKNRDDDKYDDDYNGLAFNNLMKYSQLHSYHDEYDDTAS